MGKEKTVKRGNGPTPSWRKKFRTRSEKTHTGGKEKQKYMPKEAKRDFKDGTDLRDLPLERALYRKRSKTKGKGMGLAMVRDQLPKLREF